MSVVRSLPASGRALRRPDATVPTDRHLGPAAGCVFFTKLGWMAARWEGPRLAGLAFDHASAQTAAAALRLEPTESRAAHIGPFIQRMQRYAAGHADDFLDVELETGVETPFRQRVVHYCRRIAAGQTLTYSQLAARAGSPGAARAVGNIMASNPFPLIVPCHRVVGANGGLGGYSATHGLQTKRMLLEREGAL